MKRKVKSALSGALAASLLLSSCSGGNEPSALPSLENTSATAATTAPESGVTTENSSTAPADVVADASHASDATVLTDKEFKDRLENALLPLQKAFCEAYIAAVDSYGAERGTTYDANAFIYLLPMGYEENRRRAVENGDFADMETAIAACDEISKPASSPMENIEKHASRSLNYYTDYGLIRSNSFRLFYLEGSKAAADYALNSGLAECGLSTLTNYDLTEPEFLSRYGDKTQFPKTEDDIALWNNFYEELEVLKGTVKYYVEKSCAKKGVSDIIDIIDADKLSEAVIASLIGDGCWYEIAFADSPDEGGGMAGLVDYYIESFIANYYSVPFGEKTLSVPFFSWNYFAKDYRCVPQSTFDELYVYVDELEKAFAAKGLDLHGCYEGDKVYVSDAIYIAVPGNSENAVYYPITQTIDETEIKCVPYVETSEDDAATNKENRLPVSDMVDFWTKNTEQNYHMRDYDEDIMCRNDFYGTDGSTTVLSYLLKYVISGCAAYEYLTGEVPPVNIQEVYDKVIYKEPMITEWTEYILTGQFTVGSDDIAYFDSAMIYYTEG